VRRTWEDAKVPDRSDDAYLVLMHWDELQLDRPDDVPARIQDLWEHAPAGGPREFRNRLAVLAPAKQNHDAMLRSVRRHLALARLLATPERIGELTDDKRAELKNLAKQSELEARIAVCNHVNLLFVPGPGGLRGEELDLVTQASLKPNQTEAVLDRLAAMEKTLTAGSKPLDPRLIRSRLGKLLDQPLPTSGLLEQFARRGDLKLVLDRKQIVDLIVAGVRNAVWEYQDPELGDDGWGTAERAAKSVRIDAQTLLHPVGTAPPPAVPPCPLCGKVHTGPCPDVPPPPPTGSSFGGEGSAAAALAAARQAAVDASALASGRVPDAAEVAICFADLVGFTKLGERIDSAALGDVAQRLEELARDVIRPPVRLIKTIGDAAMLQSSDPGALLDGALALVARADAEGEQFPQLRAGIAHGQALERAGDWYGRPVNLASRVTGVARPGSVLVAESARDAVDRDRYEWSFAGARRLKGVDGEVKLFRARPAGDSRSPT
jgi:class 3 adenylate cyclase